MAELHDVLQRRRGEVRPEPGGFERLRHRRDRRRRIQAVLSAVLAFIVAGIAVWGLSHALERRGSMPASRPITPANVARLRLAWSVPSSGAVAAAPALSRNEVYATGFSLRAFPRTCGTKTCGPYWEGARSGGPLGAQVNGVAVGKDLVFIAESDARGFRQDCGRGGAVCAPTWEAGSGSIGGFSAVYLSDGRVYAQGHNDLYVFPERCSMPCRPLWRARINVYGGDVSAAGGGFVYVQDSQGLTVFRSLCRSDGGRCLPEWRVPTESFGSRPAYSAGHVYVAKGFDEVAAYRSQCGHRRGCRPDAVWQVRNVIGVAVFGQRLYATTNQEVIAFDTRCAAGSRCQPEWRTPVLEAPPSVPTVADGLVFFTAGDRVYALSENCGSRGTVCVPVWNTRLPGGTGTELSSPTVTVRGVYVEATGGALYVFQVPAR